MQDHFGLTDQQMAELASKNITIADMYHAVPLFKAQIANVSMVSLMYYIDTHGDFTEREVPSKIDIIANMVLTNLPVLQQIAVAEYIEVICDGQI